MKKRILTGITTTGVPHIGNYIGAIRPALEMASSSDESFFFLADYHSIIKNQNATEIGTSVESIALAWLSCGLDPNKSYFYRQSDVPEILELSWILNCITAKGLMNRAHAYKAASSLNKNDPDKGITMGLFSYPILMAADILMFDSTHVPVGSDQIQHLEMTRDIAARFNHLYSELLTIPEPIIQDNEKVVLGLDGRKMSKSYGNVIPLLDTEKKLKKSIMKIVTNSLEPGAPRIHQIVLCLISIKILLVKIWLRIFKNYMMKAYLGVRQKKDYLILLIVSLRQLDLIMKSLLRIKNTLMTF